MFSELNDKICRTLSDPSPRSSELSKTVTNHRFMKFSDVTTLWARLVRLRNIMVWVKMNVC